MVERNYNGRNRANENRKWEGGQHATLRNASTYWDTYSNKYFIALYAADALANNNEMSPLLLEIC